LPSRGVTPKPQSGSGENVEKSLPKRDVVGEADGMNNSPTKKTEMSTTMSEGSLIAGLSPEVTAKLIKLKKLEGKYQGISSFSSQLLGYA